MTVVWAVDLEGSLEAVCPGQQASIIPRGAGRGLTGAQVQVNQAHLIHGQVLQAGQHAGWQAYQEWHGSSQVVLFHR